MAGELDKAKGAIKDGASKAEGKAKEINKEAKNKIDKAAKRWREDSELRKKVFIGLGVAAATAAITVGGILFKKKQDGDKKILPGK